MDKTLADLLAEVQEEKQRLDAEVASARAQAVRVYDEKKQEHDRRQKEGRARLTAAGKGLWYYAATIDWQRREPGAKRTRTLIIQPYPDASYKAFLPVVRTGPLADIALQASQGREKVLFTAPQGLRRVEEFRDAPVRVLSSLEAGRLEQRRRKYVRSLNDVLEEVPRAYPEYRAAKSELERTSRDRELAATRYSFILRNMPLLDEAVTVRKGSHNALSRREAYSVWLGDQPVLLYGDPIRALRTSRRDEPLVLVDIDPAAVEVGVARELLGLVPDDLFTPSGYKLFGKQREDAEQVFWLMRNGIEILPHPTEPLGYAQRRPPASRGVGEPVRFHTREQQFLRDLKPDRIEPGELLGSGGAYLAFYFGPVVLVEADEEDRATYRFTLSHFDQLRHEPRERVVREQPKGFLGRIFHYEDAFDRWRQEVVSSIGR